MFRHLGPDDGLPHQDVTAIAQDGEGFLWVGTYDGLNRIDLATGAVLKIAPDPQDPTGLAASLKGAGRNTWRWDASALA